MDIDIIEDAINEILTITDLLIFYSQPIISQDNAANVAKIIQREIKILQKELADSPEKN